MKTRIIVLTVLFFVSLHAQDGEQAEQPNLFLIDKVEAVIFGKEETELITKSDLDRPSLDGVFRSMDDIIFERSVLIDAKQRKIADSIDEEAMEVYFTRLQREHNLSAEEFENIFASAGYTMEEGRQQLQMMQTVSTMLDVKIRSNLIVPRRDVEVYYNEHPEMTEAVYTVQRLFVPFSKKMSREDQRATLIKNSHNPTRVKNAQWEEPFTINHSDVAVQKQFIYTMEPGEVSVPQEIEGGFELFRLVEKITEARRSFEDSYRDIVDILRRPKYEELMANYRKSLFDNISIVYF